MADMPAIHAVSNYPLRNKSSLLRFDALHDPLRPTAGEEAH
jgi:hypothetical protein